MDVRLTWEAILAIIAILGFFSGVVALYIKLQFKGFIEELEERLDKRYVLKGDCQVREVRVSGRLALLENKVDDAFEQTT